MESIGAFPEGDWESFSRMFSSEDLDFTPHFLGQCSFPNSHFGQSSSSFCPNISHDHDQANTESLFHTLDSLNSNLQYLSQESSYTSTSATQESYYFSDSCHIPATNDVSLPIFPMDHEKNNVDGSYIIPALSDINVIMGEAFCNVKEDYGNHRKRMSDAAELDKINPESPPNPKKKARVSRDVSWVNAVICFNDFVLKESFLINRATFFFSF